MTPERHGTLDVEIWNGLPGTVMAPSYSAVDPLMEHPLGLGQAPPSEKITGP